MTRQDYYCTHLQNMDPEAWDEYLIAESALPGPRANLELAQAAADVGGEAQFAGWLNLGPEAAPEDSPTLFLTVCGTIGLGRLVSEGRTELIPPSSTGRLRSTLARARGGGPWAAAAWRPRPPDPASIHA